MPWKDIEKQRAAIRRHYYANRQAYIDKAAKRKTNIRQKINKIKEASPCSDCKLQFPYYVMDFDHIGIKQIEVSKLIHQGNMSKIEAEIAECEIVCSNCHRVRTHIRKNQV